MANETSAEELEKQRQMQQQQEMMQRRFMTIQQINNVLQYLDASTVLKTFGKYGIEFICPNPQISYSLLTGIYQKLTESEPEESIWVDIFNALNSSISRTNLMRFSPYGMNNSMGMGMNMGMMNPMMGMGMGMPGMDMSGMGMMNPMMGMNMGMMNPMMGMGMMNPMMGMGMPGMGMNQNQTQSQNGKYDIEKIKTFIKQNLQPNYMGNSVDPIVFLQLLGNFKVELDFSEDKQFSQNVMFAIQQSIGNMNTINLMKTWSVVMSMYNSEMQKNFNKNNKNQNNGMNPMMMGMGMMNPMMMGMGMPGMGMMNPMMMGMNSMFDQNNQNNCMNPMMGMNMGMMNPMMGMGMGMPGMGMNMPGMQTSAGSTPGMVW